MMCDEKMMKNIEQKTRTIIGLTEKLVAEAFKKVNKEIKKKTKDKFEQMTLNRIAIKHIYQQLRKGLKREGLIGKKEKKPNYMG